MPSYDRRRGRIYVVTGGSPSGALVAAACDCLWTLPDDKHAWTMAPAAVLHFDWPSDVRENWAAQKQAVMYLSADSVQKYHHG